MVNLHTLLYLFAFVFFILASLPNLLPVRFEWLAAACLVLTLLL